MNNRVHARSLSPFEKIYMCRKRSMFLNAHKTYGKCKNTIKTKQQQLTTVKFMILLVFTIDITAATVQPARYIQSMYLWDLPFISFFFYMTVEIYINMVREYKRPALTKQSNRACRFFSIREYMC